MSSEDRQHQILALARSQGEVDVLKLAAELGVAPETLRRDLRQLEQHGLVRRTHGGAYPVETARFETTLEGISSEGGLGAAATELGNALTELGTALQDLSAEISERC